VTRYWHRRFVAWVVASAMAACASGCHRADGNVRAEAVDGGGGGPGSLSSVHAKILAALAAGNYQYARELLQLAADLGPEEKAAYEQMISAAERGLLPFAQDKLQHIFREAAGHFSRDTPAARELIQTTATEANLLGITKYGYSVYQRVLETGAQVWVYVRNEMITNAGINEVPVARDRLLKQ
jgi:hypothetical protein